MKKGRVMRPFGCEAAPQIFHFSSSFSGRMES